MDPTTEKALRRIQRETDLRIAVGLLIFLAATLFAGWAVAGFTSNAKRIYVSPVDCYFFLPLPCSQVG